MPTPQAKENESEFVGRCMENETMVEEYPTAKQRAAVCHSQYEKPDDEKLSEVTELAATRNKAGADKAASLIREGKIVETSSWKGPTAAAENKMIEANGWAKYGQFFLGRDKAYDPETKAHWKYPFSSDFSTVSINGLRAIRGRAAQTDEDEIFATAGKLLEAAKEKTGDDEEELAPRWLPRQPWLPAAPRLPRAKRLPRDRGGSRGRIDPSGRWRPGRRQWEEGESDEFETFCLEAQEPTRVDKENGIIEGISILTTGEAKGHQMMISQKTLESSITLMLGKSLPAYLSHAGATGDRLLTEAGFFSGFYREKNKIRASRFTALDTFKQYDREKYDRLFEIAEVAPETFGVSIVFEGQLFWEMSDGSEQTMEVGLDAPENARFDYPTVRPLKITSADFVDTPAANRALFSEKGDKSNKGIETMNTLETIQAAHEIVDALGVSASSAPDHVAAAAAEKPVEIKIAEPEPKKKAKKKKTLAAKTPEEEDLAEQDEEDKKDEQRGEEDEIAKEDQGEDEAKEDDAAEKDEDETDADKLEKSEEDELEEPDDEYQEKMRAAVEEVYSHAENLINRLREVMDMTGVPDTRKEAAKTDEEELTEVGQLRARVSELEKVNTGTEPLKESTQKTFASAKDAKKHLIEKHLELHPGDTRSTAVLAVAKTNPELFRNN